MAHPVIIYQDDSLIALDKPSGLLVHPADGEPSEETVADWLLKKFPQVEGLGEEGRYGIVHRLDKETSGVMVAALTAQSYARLKKMFARRDMHKTYRAFVYGNMKDDRGVIDRPIGRSSTGNRTSKLLARLGQSFTAHEAGLAVRQAQTTFRTLLRSGEASYLELYPKTGRTHQIRVHLSVLQHPVICDRRYAPARPPTLGFMRLALHAYRLQFVHPITEKEIRFEAPLPQDFITGEQLLQGSGID